ncbi:metallophosphoesterase [Sutcliffiella rhizosphaerae]|uniref:Calcineurin-like phosphoesterase domain-containing protein n=1 Tax=Sutcliffiella rhizosphaerae TaxID=2880967 RepID=A0ABM8YSQ0_9BACI|nr:metallophosphoesterase [Sutcliffiella rhizosphaerae]CAG9623040.1 putative protein YpbG [Sutcliffiella rhizosphaerae]
MRKKIGTHKKLIVFITIVLSLLFFVYFQNNSIVVTNQLVTSEKIPESFRDYKIVHLSDLHSKAFGRDQNKLVRKVESENPDMIVFTGDLVDSRKFDADISIKLMEELIDIAPIYYVTGNHEWWSGEYVLIEEKLKGIGVEVMRNTRNEVILNNESIYIFGIDDPSQFNSPSEQTIVEEAIVEATDGNIDESYRVLLSHRPELFSTYVKYKFDLVFSGHAHGGQVRVPFLGGLIAPNQGLLPAYTSGKYTVDHTTMIVNRGLGNSIIPLRIFNRPEIVVVTLLPSN